MTEAMSPDSCSTYRLDLIRETKRKSLFFPFENMAEPIFPESHSVCRIDL